MGDTPLSPAPPDPDTILYPSRPAGLFRRGLAARPSLHTIKHYRSAGRGPTPPQPLAVPAPKLLGASRPDHPDRRARTTTRRKGRHGTFAPADHRPGRPAPAVH